MARKPRRKSTETEAKPKRRGNPENLKRPESPTYGIDYVAKETGMDKGKVRAKLRALDIKKEGMVYDFKNKSGANAIIKKLKAA